MSALMLMDMERMCLEQGDQILIDSGEVAQSLLRFLPGNQRPLRVQPALSERAEPCRSVML